MPEPQAIVAALAILVAIMVLLWFALGTQGNIRRGEAFLGWLQGGLPVLGSRTTVRWFGSSAVELKITDPKEPFREAETLVVLEPRDVGWLWAWSRSRGRRDFLILRARLRASPKFELEAGDPAGWTGYDRLKKLDLAAWEEERWGDVSVAHTRGADTRGIRRAWDELDSMSGGMWRHSVRRDTPHIEVHLRPPDLARGPAEPLFRRFRELAERVTKG